MALAGFTANRFGQIAICRSMATTNKWSDKGKISLNVVPAYTLMYV